MAEKRNEIETNRRGLLRDDMQELSKREMENVTGGGWRTVVGTALCVASPFVCYAAHKVHEATTD